MNEMLAALFAAGAFVVTARAASAVAANVGDRLRGRWARSSAVRAVLASAPLAFAASMALAVLSPQALLGGCHCVTHPHHIHLCLDHASFSWALVATAALAAPLLAAGLRVMASLGVDYWRTVCWAARLPVDRTIDMGSAQVHLSREACGQAWTVGLLRPRILVDAALWARLTPDERRAIAAHERAHVERRDPLTLLFLRAVTGFAAPGTARRLVASWRRAAELACDRAAARAIGDTAVVASALVACGRAQRAAAAPAALGATGADLEARVLALLDQPSIAAPTTRLGDRAHALWWTLGIVVGWSTLAGSATHHALETLLGWLA